MMKEMRLLDVAFILKKATDNIGWNIDLNNENDKIAEITFALWR